MGWFSIGFLINYESLEIVLIFSVATGIIPFAVDPRITPGNVVAIGAVPIFRKLRDFR